MAIKTKDGYKCGYCGKKFTDPVDCDTHKESHKLIYVALSTEDLNNLVHFIFTKEEKLLNNKIVERLQGYLKGNFHPIKIKNGK